METNGKSLDVDISHKGNVTQSHRGWPCNKCWYRCGEIRTHEPHSGERKMVQIPGTPVSVLKKLTMWQVTIQASNSRSQYSPKKKWKHDHTTTLPKCSHHCCFKVIQWSPQIYGLGFKLVSIWATHWGAGKFKFLSLIPRDLDSMGVFYTLKNTDPKFLTSCFQSYQNLAVSPALPLATPLLVPYPVAQGVVS
jgi:hypothetical protein